MSERQSFPVAVRLDGRDVRASTSHAGDIGPYVLTLATALPQEGLELHSTYTGHVGAQTRAVHLLLAPGRAAETLVRSHSEHDLPVWAARERCLLDHYAMLQQLGTLTGHTLAVDVDDQALRAVDLPAHTG